MALDADRVLVGKIEIGQQVRLHRHNIQTQMQMSDTRHSVYCDP
jgi:hypothetical protein